MNDAPRFYPAMLDVRKRRAVVVGAGKIAARKAAELAACGADVLMIDDRPSYEAEALAARVSVTLKHARYERGDLAGACVTIVATDDVVTQEAAWREALELGIPVNTVDEAARCTFIAPSILRRGPLTIAVSTGGTNPGLARRIRERLEAQFSPAFGAFLEIAGRARERLRSAGVGYARRDSFAGEVFASDALALVDAGQRKEAERLVDGLAQRYGADEMKT
jgi:precorrin-2 dehydrogenase/sirohydrochlorin ferrochelatase